MSSLYAMSSIRLAATRFTGVAKPSFILSRNRFYSTEVTKKKKKAPAADITQIPIKNIGVVADYYVPPKFFSLPVTSWHNLLFRRLGLFAVNTYNIVKFRRETGLKPKFNDWKEQAVEQFVKANKVFAASCSQAPSKRESYIETQLAGVCGSSVISSMVKRSRTLPTNAKLDWKLEKIESNPKVIMFGALPDSNNITALVQFVLQFRTKQKFLLKTLDKKEPMVSERSVESNLVYTLDPFSNEMVFVGSVFRSDHNRGLLPDTDINDARALIELQNRCADIFRNQK